MYAGLPEKVARRVIACYSTSGMTTDVLLYSLLKDSEQEFEVNIRSTYCFNLK